MKKKKKEKKEEEGNLPSRLSKWISQSTTPWPLFNGHSSKQSPSSASQKMLPFPSIAIHFFMFTWLHVPYYSIVSSSLALLLFNFSLRFPSLSLTLSWLLPQRHLWIPTKPSLSWLLPSPTSSQQTIKWIIDLELGRIMGSWTTPMIQTMAECPRSNQLLPPYSPSLLLHSLLLLSFLFLQASASQSS